MIFTDKDNSLIILVISGFIVNEKIIEISNLSHKKTSQLVTVRFLKETILFYCSLANCAS